MWLYNEKDAAMSECKRYRWWLERNFHNGNGKTVCFIMLNPSIADADIDDPTIRRCMGFANSWGFSRLLVRNLFCLRSTDPKGLLTADVPPVGNPRADFEIAASKENDLVVCAWGTKVPMGRDREALKILHDHVLWCLGTTKDGFPRHPLYVKATTELQMFKGAK